MEPKLIEKLTDWKNFSLSQSDLDFIYNFLLEKETPLSTNEIAEAVVNERIRILKNEFKKSASLLGRIYRPSETYQSGEKVTFTQQENQVATVISVRDGHNPDFPSFQVTTFRFEDGTEKEFATVVENHKLNALDPIQAAFPGFLPPEETLSKFGKSIRKTIRRELGGSEDLVCISDFWFPSALLADVNLGFLNLAEAVMEMENGVPVVTSKILEMIEYPADSNTALTEFSFNYALKNDERFDEVGSLGKILWTLNSLEPEDVRKVPMTLRYTPTSYAKYVDDIDLDCAEYQIHDELDTDSLEQPYHAPEFFDICITYPHWKAGTLPLLGSVVEIFPSAMEAKHYVFDFIDEANGEKFMGWIIREENYVSGLKPWYRANKIIPGSLIRIRPGNDSTEVIISKIPARSQKDWIRTAQFDAKGRLFFETRQQPVTTAFDERLAIYVENSPNLDATWENFNKKDVKIERLIKQIFREITRENPQGIIHFSELYAGLNLVHRIAPKELLSYLISDESIVSLPNLHFKLNTTDGTEES